MEISGVVQGLGKRKRLVPTRGQESRASTNPQYSFLRAGSPEV